MENAQVLAMYDIRGIQDYIFKTNRVKEIIGASALVENIIEKAFLYASKICVIEGRVISEWEQNADSLDLEILHETDVMAQLLFVGGGNAYVMYKNKELCVEINKCMAKYVLEHTYSLQLAIAVIEKTDNYFDDYKKLNREMTRVKQAMPMTKYVGAFPIVEADNITGYPLTKGNDEQKNCTEVRLKLDVANSLAKGGMEKQFDNLVANKGEDSQIAIVHIDGNNLGMRIRELMEDKELGDSYEKSVQRMRIISRNIKRSFLETFSDMEKYLSAWSLKEKKRSGMGRLRRIILAGDDVTFVCNAHVAIGLVEYFSTQISEKLLFERTDYNKEENIKKYGFSVCAGIALINSHFPFKSGYEVAGECCDNAKKRAKESAYQVDGRVGNWVDFQICKSVQVGNLDKNREENYRISDDIYLLKRPYYLSGISNGHDMDKLCAKISLNEFKAQVAFFKDVNKMPRSFVKDLRNTYPYGEGEMNKLIRFAKSRNRIMPDTTMNAFEEGIAKWYDALEMTDIYEDMCEGGCHYADSN